MSGARPQEDDRRLAPWLPPLVLLLLLGLSSAVRIGTAYADPNFDSARPEGMLKSDPALLYYFTERVLESGGRAPADFRADPRVEWPDEVDVPATFTVGQEFLVAWLYPLLGGGMPLHAFCLWVMGVTASLALLGAYGLAREASGSVGWGLFAAAFWCLLPASYRTIGFVLVREDLSFPLYALHLALGLRGLRTGSRATFFASGLALAAALATWHALGFFAAIEALAVVLHFLRSGENPLAVRGMGWLVAPVVVAGLGVPVLRATGALVAPAALAGAALWIAGRGPLAGSRGRATAAFFMVLALGAALRVALSERFAEHAHVFDVLVAKLTHLGRFPDDPTALSFDARLLWQGPFETLRRSWAWSFLGLALFALPLPLLALRRVAGQERRGAWGAEDSRAVLALATLLSLPAAWLFARAVILPSLLLPVALAAFLAARPGRVGAVVGGLALALQALHGALWVARHEIRWYRPPVRNVEIARLVEALPALVPEGEPVAADFMNSTAILAHTRRPIVLQPKYETRASRRRAEEFLTTFYFESPEALRELLVERYRCRHLVVDRFTLWTLSRETAGLPRSSTAPPAGSAAEVLLSRDDATLSSIPGYELLYRSAPDLRAPDGQPYDLFRLYRLAPGPPAAEER